MFVILDFFHDSRVLQIAPLESQFDFKSSDTQYVFEEAFYRMIAMVEFDEWDLAFGVKNCR